MIRGRSPHYGKFTRTFPEDADGDALYQVANQGSDLSQPMEIDFVVAVPSESAGKAVARSAGTAGYLTEVAADEDGEWIVYCTRTMVASYEAIVKAQEDLGQLAAPLGGEPDGWETAGNAEDAVQPLPGSHGQRLGGRGGW